MRALPETDLIGKTFGRLTVEGVEKHLSPSGRSIRKVSCICSCGNKCLKDQSKVVSLVTQSCGCLVKEKAKQLKIKEPGISSFNEVFGSYKRSAKKRGYEFNLTPEAFKEIATKPCHFCGRVGTNSFTKTKGNGSFVYNGVDRYENHIGYEVSNCVSCCKTCNQVKMDMSVLEMENHLTLMMSRSHIWRRTE